MMSIRKRLRIVLAALTQQWSEKTCSDCGAKWMHQGPPMPHLIAVCDRCEDRILDTMMDKLNREYQQQRS